MVIKVILKGLNGVSCSKSTTEIRCKPSLKLTMETPDTSF